jgi:hypothetical protein
MQFCYLDETGTGQDTVVIAVGVVANANRMYKTKREWRDLLKTWGTQTDSEVCELHTTNLYRGQKEWGGLEGSQRAQIFTEIIHWLQERNHKITFSAIDKKQFNEKLGYCEICQRLGDPWQAAAFHIVLSLQKEHQTRKSNKGHTVMVFDRRSKTATLSELLYDPPDWSDEYYNYKGKKDRLDQIIDTPFFGDSRHVELIQVADFIAFILRRFSDLHDYDDKERYKGESDRINNWVNNIKSMLSDTSTRYLRKKRSRVADVFYDLAPESLREL